LATEERMLCAVGITSLDLLRFGDLSQSVNKFYGLPFACDETKYSQGMETFWRIANSCMS